MSMWLQVTAHFDEPPEDWARITEVYAAHGIEGTVQSDQPATLSGYLWEPSPDVVAALKLALLKATASDVTTDTVDDEDWVESWKQYFVPRRVGRRFLIRPTWERVEPADGELQIVLDPGQSFGTGDHPTTRLCLALLELLPVAGAAVADIGCGSGVLAIGAGLLGAEAVHAVDIEPLAVEATQQNAVLNGVDVMARQGSGFAPLPPGPYDIVLSNVISAVLIRLAPEASLRVKFGGWWVVSGIIEANWPDVAEAANRSGFATHQVFREGDWVAAIFRH